ncbi:MAG: carbohydrate ABC transporter permease [Cetobacterium sp.]|uniref:Multiple sugar transport system permease protein n=1 Tax=Cetobacterium ceti TaxID=180163 RepID=A0A1T4L902_9FUSO|nr:carbohydrate ABC transporter permease [Cetobacterium ceti]MCJ8342737.1 carbohydrate ABC transporter permease [Cetobacterium sp.]SJZ50977.1 multiple sugar transport system permease protein [Cetobacterium ceti]
MKKKRVSFFDIFNHGVFIIFALIVILPLLITLFSSFKTSIQIARESVLAFPRPFTFENYTEVFKDGNVLVALKNSFLLVILTVIINSFLASMVAYSLSRFEFKMKRVFFFLLSVGMLLPGFIAEITRFGIIANLGVYDTIYAPLLIYVGTDLMQIYIYKQFIDQVPFSLDESAMIDGCSYFRIYWKIIFPVIIPATATLAILKSVAVLNDMFTPYLYMPSPHNATLTTMLMNYVGRSGSWSKLSAAVIVVMIPGIVLYLVFRKKILAGMAAGAVKE